MSHHHGAPETGPLIKLTLNANGDAGKYAIIKPTGEVRGDVELLGPDAQSLKDEWRDFIRQEIMPNDGKPLIVAAVALLLPFAIVLTGTALGNAGAFWLNLILAGAAALAGVAAGLNQVRTAPHIVFGLTVFAATSGVLLIVAKVYGLPGS